MFGSSNQGAQGAQGDQPAQTSAPTSSSVMGASPFASVGTGAPSIFANLGAGGGMPSPPPGGGLFSNLGKPAASTPTPSTAASGSSAFGATANNASSSLLSRITLPTTTTSAATPAPAATPLASPFGSFTNAQQGGLGSAPASASGSNVFGNATTSNAPSVLGNLASASSAATPNKPSIFASSTTPAGAPPTDGPKAAESSSAAPAATSSSFFSLKPSSAAPATTATTSAAPSPGLFGAAATTSAPDAAAEKSTATATTSAPALGGMFAAAAKTTAPASTSATTAAPTLGLGFTTAGTAAKDTSATNGAAGSSALGSSTMGPLSNVPRLKNRTMDEIITRWSTDLVKYQKEFKDQAAKVTEWDRVLVENGEKIQKLYSSTYEAEKASTEIERQLANVESQQDELSAWLDRYEQDLDDLANKHQFGLHDQVAGPDQERERTYKLAEKLTDRMDDMAKDLTNMIKDINEMSSTLSKGSKPDDPLSQIVRVLNGHLTQLQWIDTNAAALHAKVAAAQKSGNALGNNFSGPETDAAESFYRSYMGRK